MGSLNLHPIGELQRDWALVNFVETGTWRGDGLLHAMQFPFRSLVSIEASRELTLQARMRVHSECPQDVRWEILTGDSSAMVHLLLLEWGKEMVAGPTLWWLDAHLPERYHAEATRLPLEQELSHIVTSGMHHMDVFILDDWRLYEHGTYHSGPFEHTPPGDGSAIRDLLEPTHTLTVDMRAEGALLAVPK